MRNLVLRALMTASRKRPLLIEVAIVSVFLLVWLAPVIAAWAVSRSGRKFSLVGQEWQNLNADIVGTCIVIALFSGVAVAGLALGAMRRRPRPKRVDGPRHLMSRMQRLLVIVIGLISGWGLFVSFGGPLFEKDYSGPVGAWLNYGAWSVTFLLSLGLLVGDYLTTRPFRLWMVFVVTAVFLPSLLSGSRIDFLSFMLVLAVYAVALSDGRFHVRLLWGATILAWAGFVAILVGQLRYPSVVHFLSGGQLMTSPVTFTADMVYLSTLGDIGASVFQIVGMVRDHAQGQIDLSDVMLTYLIRMVPGPLYANRPGDISSQLREPIGGGALHALGEGYLILGYWGCAAVGAIFGGLIAFSIYFGRRFRKTPSPILWILYIFPWLLLIRAGWYQVFALFKSIEVFLVLLLLLHIVGWAAGEDTENTVTG